MSVIASCISIAAGLFVAMLIGLEIGRRMGVRQLAKSPGDEGAGTGAVEGAVFALLGLLIAFTFTGAASRFDIRRAQIAQEANAIGTAYLRLDLLPETDRPELQEYCRRYVDMRVHALTNVDNQQAVVGDEARAGALQQQIWAKAQAAIQKDPRPQVAMLVTPALNEMFDMATTRNATARMHTPEVILWLLLALALIAALLAGYSMRSCKTRNWLHMLSFAAITSLTLYVILDFEHPRLGIIRLDTADQVLLDLRESMK